MIRLLFILLVLTGPVWGQVPELTREQAVQQALAQLSTYSQAVGNATISGLDVAVAETARRPKFEFAAPSFIFTSPSLQPGFNQSFVSANGVLETTALLRLRGELDISGVLGLEVQRTQALYQAAAAGSLVARQNLVLATEQAYYSLALASARVDSSQRNLATAQAFEKVTQLLFKAGEVPGVDLERAHLLIRDRQADLENQLGLQKGAQAALKAFLGLPGDVTVETTRLPDNNPDSKELEIFRTELIQRRPELSQLDAQIDAGRREVELAQATLVPRLTYSLGVGADTSSLHPQGLSSGLGVQAQLALLIPLDDGGLAEAKEKQANLRIVQLETSKVLALRQFGQQYQTAIALVQAAMARIALTRENLSQAEKIQEVAVARYRAGEARIIEVTDAQNALALQRLNWLQAQTDYQLALAQLRYAVAVAPEKLP